MARPNGQTVEANGPTVGTNGPMVETNAVVVSQRWLIIKEYLNEPEMAQHKIISEKARDG